LLSDVRMSDAGAAVDALVQSSSERILGPMLRRFSQDILSTLEFFQDQRVSGCPASLEVFGATDRIKGLDDLLRFQLAIPAEPQGDRLLDALVDQSHAPGVLPGLRAGGTLNLLQHAGTDLKVGSMVYGFRNERLTLASAIAQDDVANRSDSARQKAMVKGRRKGGRRGAPDQPTGGLTLSALIARLKGGTPDEAAVVEEGDRAKQERQFLLALALIVGGVLYLGYQQLEAAQIVRNGAVGQVSSGLQSIATTRRALGSDSLARRQGGEVDKVLWTEKFLLLSKAMNEKMWLSDLYLTSESRTVSGGSVETKKLVMEGAVLPSTDGHILEIARYINALQTIDNGAFMSDFRQITFQGATIDQSSRDTVIRFGIEAWYDSNKRIETQRSQASGGVTAVDAANQANRHYENQEKAIQENMGKR